MSAIKTRMLVAALSLSAAGLVALVEREGYTDNAIRPTPLDVPTMGFGSTIKPGGAPVRMGERTTPPKALRMALSHISGDEQVVKRCAGEVTLTQAEYDLFIDFAYNIGVHNFCASTMLKRLKAGDRAGACHEFVRWKKHKGVDCSTPGNKICGGLWLRRLQARDKCMQDASGAMP